MYAQNLYIHTRTHSCKHSATMNMFHEQVQSTNDESWLVLRGPDISQEIAIKPDDSMRNEEFQRRSLIRAHHNHPHNPKHHSTLSKTYYQNTQYV